VRPSLVLPALLLSAATCIGCTIPVFRFALDRWHADHYRLELRAEDAKDAAVAAFVRNLDAASGINLEVERSQDTDSILRMPASDGTGTELWRGTLTRAALDGLIDSEARREIAAKLLSGDAAVWVLIDNGDPEGAERAATAINKRLRYLEKVIQLPKIDPNDPSSRLGPGPALRTSFSLVRIQSHHNEAPLLSMLSANERDLVSSGKPWTSVVFGRGRVLGSWPIESMEDAHVEELALFLTGACSCQVKRQNPGWDLLLQFDWESKLQSMGVPALPSSASKIEPDKPPNQTPESIRIEPPTPASAQTKPRRVPIGWLALLVVLAWSFLRRKLPPS
jgi:hypothetical protein